jgi:uncharacterized cupin superfamily protein
MNHSPPLLKRHQRQPVYPRSHFRSHAHQLRNESQTVVLYLEIGDRTVGDGVTYPDDDIKIIVRPDGRPQIVRKNGLPL